MSRLTVKTLVVVVGKHLPVAVSVHGPAMVVSILAEVKTCHTWLSVHAVEFFVPLHSRYLGSIKINPDEPLSVNVNVNRQQPIILLHKIGKFVKVWRLRKFSVQAIRPAVIFA